MTPIDDPLPWDACLDCGYLYDWYMVTSEVWEAAGLPPDALCCLACLEHRLDRPLTITDFTLCLINRLAFAAAGKLHVIMEDEARREEESRRIMEREPGL